jgi:hypothetical protein
MFADRGAVRGRRSTVRAIDPGSLANPADERVARSRRSRS